jgi:hypothetical protein
MRSEGKSKARQLRKNCPRESLTYREFLIANRNGEGFKTAGHVHDYHII